MKLYLNIYIVLRTCVINMLLLNLNVDLVSAVLLQYFTGLECGHKFCMQCWGDYLTTKIIEEGMGQVHIPALSTHSHWIGLL